MMSYRSVPLLARRLKSSRLCANYVLRNSNLQWCQRHSSVIAKGFRRSTRDRLPYDSSNQIVLPSLTVILSTKSPSRPQCRLHTWEDRRWLSTNSSNLKEQTDSKGESPESRITSDPPMVTWVDIYLPHSWKPYARLARMDKPIGTWLLLWPCFWSTALASSTSLATVGSSSSVLDVMALDVSLLGLFGVGAFVMRGAGCTINDLWDQDVDRQVERTRNRPLAAGDVTTTQAIAFLALQLSSGLAVLLSLPHTWYCFQWGVASLPLVVTYPLMKRFFPYPQLFLGLTFNWGAWMGWAAYYGSMDPLLILPLYGSGVTWTLVYDTIYAHQDKEDDSKLGLQSTALTFGKDDATQKLVLHGLAGLTWAQWMWLGSSVECLSYPYHLGASAAYAHLVWQIQTADFNDPHNLALRFRSNSAVGAMIFASLASGGVMTALL